MSLWSPEDNLECHYSNVSHHFYWDRDSRYPVSPWVGSIGMPAGPRHLSVPASLTLGLQWHTSFAHESWESTRVLLLQALYQLSCLPSLGFSLDFSFQINKMQCFLWASQWEGVALTSHQRRFFLQKTETFTESYHWSKGREQPTTGYPTPTGTSITPPLHLKCQECSERGGERIVRAGRPGSLQ